MSIVSEKNIEKISFLYAIIVVGVMTFSTGALFIAKKISTMRKDMVEIEQDFISQQKAQLKKDVESIIKRVDVRRLSTEQLMEERLKNRVLEIREMATGMYLNLQGRYPPEKISEMIRESIRPVRYNEKHGYFFIVSLEGEAILYPIEPEFEGKNIITDKSEDDARIVENMIRIARDQGSGFLRYPLAKPGDAKDKLTEKISYVTFLEELNWIIGTGEYFDNLVGFAKNAIKNDLSESLGVVKEDYYFVYDLHNKDGGTDFATMLINNNRPDLVGKKLSDNYVDVNGKEFRKEFLQGIRDTGEAFVVYWYRKPDGSGNGRKLSYFQLYPEWNWVFARGIYFDSLDEILIASKEELSGKVRSDIYMLCFIFLGAVCVALVVAYRFSKGLQNIFDSYRDTQQKHLNKLEVLNRALEKQNQTDALTQIFNRGFFNIQLVRETSRASRYETPLSVVLLDIDHFKMINDNYGHLAGDTVLQDLAALVGDNIRHSDYLARWGGEEFSILAPGVELGNAVQFADKLRVLIEKHDFSIDQQVTCSFGISCYQAPEDGNSFLQRADVALYRAKTEGRNRCVGK